MVWGFCVYFVYMIPLETDVLRKHRFQKHMFCVCKEMSPRDISFMHTKHMFLRKTLIITIIFGAYIYLCLPPYNSNFQYLEIKSLVPWTWN